MEPWPLMAWGLMLTAIASWIKAVQSRDFTEKDIIFLHPSSKHFFLDSPKALKMKWMYSMFFLVIFRIRHQLSVMTTIDLLKAGVELLDLQAVNTDLF